MLQRWRLSRLRPYKSRRCRLRPYKSRLGVNTPLIAGQTISGAEAGRIISEHKNAWFEVYQYANGPKELWITLPNSGWHHPSFITPADESTLELLTQNNIPCKTYVQGRDFGYRGPGRWLSLFCSFILTAGAVIILWWAARKKRTLPAPAGSRV